MTKEEEKLAEKFFIKMFKKEPVKLIQCAVILIGKEMRAANAATMDFSQESDLDNGRYKISFKAKLTKVKSLPHQSINQ